MAELPEFLEQAGYRRIPLQRSGVGHFHAEATLRGRAVSVLVDTGADCTLVSVALAKELALPLTMLPTKGAGAGSAAMDVYVVEDVKLELPGLAVPPGDMYAMDLSHSNEAMVAQGFAPIEAIMGRDVFEQHAAVIDYGSQSLFLKPAPRKDEA